MDCQLAVNFSQRIDPSWLNAAGESDEDGQEEGRDKNVPASCRNESQGRGTGAVAGEVWAKWPVQRVDAWVSVRAVLGAQEIPRRPVGAERDDPGGAHIDAGRDFEAHAGAAGGAAAARASGGAGGAPRLRRVDDPRTARHDGVVQRCVARGALRDRAAPRHEAGPGPGAVLLACRAGS